MKIHKLKLDPKYFEDVRTGEMKFNIRKNDRDFEVGDVLELKLYHKEAGYLQSFTAMDTNNLETGFSIYYKQVDEDKADTIKANVTTLVEADRFNKIAEIENGKQQKILNIQKVIKHYFSNGILPDDYVVLGIMVSK